MDKHEMRQYLAELETDMDKPLKKWKKESKVEDENVAQIEWQFNQSRVLLDLFWKTGEERIHLHCLHPNFRWIYEWTGINRQVRESILDRIANFAQIAMHLHSG